MEEGEISNGGAHGGDELYNALHQRLVASGEWAKLSILLKRMLDECGWETAFQDHASTQARSQSTTLSLPTLIDQLVPHAKETLPPHVKTHILSLLRDFLDRNLEDA